MLVVLFEFWARQEVVTIQNRCHYPHFRSNHVITQGGLTLTTIFNVALDNVVRNWLSTTVEDDTVIHDGLGHAVRQSMGVFYTDDGIIGSQDQDWLQGSLNILIELF